MRPLRAGIAATVVVCAALGGAPSASAAAPLPARMADTGGGSQLITAEAPRASSTSGTVTWWDRRSDGRWVKAGSAPARFGAKGLVAGSGREQGTNTTPAGLYDLPFAFGTRAAPGGTSVTYRRVRDSSWWCQDNRSRSYNRWTQPRPADCRASESEHLADYGTQYAHALVIGFNYDRPVRGRGAGIFLHVNGRAATAGCVSVPKDAMRRILTWVRPGRAPHIAIGTAGGATAITKY
ncbi:MULTISPECIES: L,D-transpeptidase family protein [unclassified Streptomyces]|uniref:L,D-transpeptidase family protein n=1 Tax=unclassified Streptomyces TaxID=2593676 RepID=UPI000DB9DD56|nr:MULTISPECIES: L,D-transpeptidase family protein [unclassified Streptomyces]MYT69422.1 L,D-transpeptidase family protein [Streptomyces sp. SID8367]RAJ79808.1 L,D-peptidoglycan transpeptidase YkuD (ErfK/YbiS/YcfS/YnhG family) [Streptomyces sp. PsTaAH-137]